MFTQFIFYILHYFYLLVNLSNHFFQRFQGLRDDLEFLLEEDISCVNLCALHCELRNTEHLVACLGLQCHKSGTLKKCNELLAKYGPETTGDRIKVKLKQGQQTSLTKQNIKVKSFSGLCQRN